MVRLGVPMLIWLWVVAGLAGLAALGLFYVVRDARLLRRRRRRKMRLFCCGKCGRVYVGGRGEPAAPCPACGRMNNSVRTM